MYALLLLICPALASDLASRVQAELDAEAGWVLHSDHPDSGIQVFSKPIPSLGVTGFKGVKRLSPDVHPDMLIGLICDVERHEEFNQTLEDSAVVGKHGTASDYYQVLDVPMVPMAPRYWLNRGDAWWDLGGVDGHHKRFWSNLPDDAYPEVRARLLERWPRAVALEASHGSWETVPLEEGGFTLIYRNVAVLGGSVPSGVVEIMSGRTLPDTMLAMEAAARAR